MNGRPKGDFPWIFKRVGALILNFALLNAEYHARLGMMLEPILNHGPLFRLVRFHSLS